MMGSVVSEQGGRGFGRVKAAAGRSAEVRVRAATAADAEALHALVHDHLKEGHLLPRDLAEVRRHASRFVVVERGGAIQACAELAPLSRTVAEVRSLVVAGHARRAGVASRLVQELQNRARATGFETLCAFTHDARFFVRQGFSIVPHMWVPEKISTDCLACPLFQHCGQYAMVLPLRMSARGSATTAVSRPVAVA